MSYICCSVSVVIIPEEVSVRDETRRKNKQKLTTARSLSLCYPLVSVKKRSRKDIKSCTFLDRGRKASFTKPDVDIP